MIGCVGVGIDLPVSVLMQAQLGLVCRGTLHRIAFHCVRLRDAAWPETLAFSRCLHTARVRF